MRSLAVAGVLLLASSAAFAQTPVLTTRMGHEVNVSVQHYNYEEPDDVDISIHGPKFGVEYTGTFALSRARRWFAQVNLRGTGVTAAYDGWCRPWQIKPNSSSPNGYQLTLGTKFACSETGDADWYAEGRALTGKDFVGQRWAIAPFAGVGFRHLSNGTSGMANYRTEQYLYVPVGATVRTAVARRVLGVTVEYDHLLHGWNTTRNSLFGSGTVPATSTTPEFTLGDFSDVSFDQHGGWALRASASYALSRSWSIEPYYTHWRVDDSPVSEGSVTFVVNSIAARQTFGYYEPHNFTNEFGVKIGWRFGGK